MIEACRRRPWKRPTSTSASVLAEPVVIKVLLLLLLLLLVKLFVAFLRRPPSNVTIFGGRHRYSTSAASTSVTSLARRAHTVRTMPSAC